MPQWHYSLFRVTCSLCTAPDPAAAHTVSVRSLFCGR
ncbi:hypothetical protein BMF94_7107 [Rhodotorula taiwanensis]|uniref:Uncharacterized protein n=1 Tax=Rhodotorula taiwanensis TaxID=741276 RepID=A0A2S5AZ08_9BASI|nr:hypothetical protein BMF94_7107 [Rhodotorula taiwanensis]